MNLSTGTGNGGKKSLSCGKQKKIILTLLAVGVLTMTAGFFFNQSWVAVPGVALVTIGFFWERRLRCPHCGVLLGLTWAGEKKCPACKKDL